jgi:DNA-binding PadR family transcriptional regulator
VSVRHAMLALLSEGPKYGLRLREEFEARTGEVWPLNVGQVYTTLQRLEPRNWTSGSAPRQTSAPRPATSS